MNFKFKILLLLLTALNYLSGQKPFKEEVYWGVWHPFTAIKVKKLYSKNYEIYNLPNTKILLDTFNNGGKLDAFRHVFFMASFSQKIKIKKLRKLGIAHEKGNYRQFKNRQKEEGERPDSLSNTMDLFNNELGFKIGSENKKISLLELKELAIKQINKGKAQIIKRKKLGTYIDCDNNIINLKLYTNKWSVPKCLVPSDYIYTD